MLNLSIMSLNEEHIDEMCDDIINQQKDGVSTHAMMMMTFNPDGTPPVDKAKNQCLIYDKYRKRLDKAGAKHGVLVQATLGHITMPNKPYPFQPSVSLITGEERAVTCCPLDPGFQKYMKDQMKTLAKSHPSIVMIDDDVGLLYKQTKGCACKYHMELFNKKALTNMTRQELYAHTQGTSDEDKRYTDIYVETQKEGLVSVVKAMREGLDEVDPSIQGIVSGIYTTTFCEFSGDTAQAFKGKGNPAIIRLNGGPYANSSQGRTFTQAFYRAAVLKENTKDKVDIYLAETDVCPHNRYSTSATLMHAHFTASILEGATGAKHWITRLGQHIFEPASGKAYRKILSKYNLFYEKLCQYVKELRPFGCRLPLSLMQNYGFVPSTQGLNIAPWSSCFLERMGFPLYFSNNSDDAVFLDEISINGFDDEEIKNFLSKTVFLTGPAAGILVERGFGDMIGVETGDISNLVINCERIGENLVASQYEKLLLTPTSDSTQIISDNVRINRENGEIESVSAAVTRFYNSLGGEAIVFCGTIDMPFKYFTAFSMLNETRKKQMIELISARNPMPVYYPEDGEVYLRGGEIEGGEIFAAIFNLGFDILEDIPLVCEKDVSKVEILLCDGKRKECEFEKRYGRICIKEAAHPLTPVILFIS